jgi:hypothetical protein
MQRERILAVVHLGRHVGTELNYCEVRKVDRYVLTFGLVEGDHHDMYLLAKAECRCKWSKSRSRCLSQGATDKKEGKQHDRGPSWRAGGLGSGKLCRHEYCGATLCESQCADVK